MAWNIIAFCSGGLLFKLYFFQLINLCKLCHPCCRERVKLRSSANMARLCTTYIITGGGWLWGEEKGKYPWKCIILSHALHWGEIARISPANHTLWGSPSPPCSTEMLLQHTVLKSSARCSTLILIPTPNPREWTLTSRELSSKGEPNSSWAEPKGGESCHEEQGGAVWSVSPTWIWISRVQWSGKKWAVLCRQARLFGIYPSLFVIVSGSGMRVPTARSTLHFVWETMWWCSQEQLPPCFCPSSHMELRWGGEHLFVCKSPYLFCTLFSLILLLLLCFSYSIAFCFQ